MFGKKYVYMDMLPDGFGIYVGGRKVSTLSSTKVEKELSLLEQLKQIKNDEKLKEKSPGKYQIQL